MAQRERRGNPSLRPNSAETPIDPPSSAIPRAAYRSVQSSGALHERAQRRGCSRRCSSATPELFPDKLRTGRAMIGVLRQADDRQRRQLARHGDTRANQVAEPDRSLFREHLGGGFPLEGQAS